jgi:hypothetical protein
MNVSATLVPPALDDSYQYEPVLRAYRPFPVEYFPSSIRTYVSAVAASLDCDPAYVALPVLSTMAAAVGSSHQLVLKQFWKEPAVLWTCVVNDGMVNVRNALDAAATPFDILRQMGQYEDRQWTAFAQKKENARRVKELVPPISRRHLVRDCRIKTLIPLLERERRGLLLRQDQLEVWLGRPNSTAVRRMEEVSQWVDIHAGQPLSMELRNRQRIDVAYPAVSLLGAVHSKSLSDKFLKARVPCELTSRLLFAAPPSEPRRWTPDDVSPEVGRAYVSTVLAMSRTDFRTKVDPPHPSLQPPVRQSNGWMDPTETVIKAMSGQTNFGPGIDEDEPIREKPETKADDGSFPDLKDMANLVEQLSPESRRRLEAFASGKGLGHSKCGEDFVKFFEELVRYTKRGEDPQPKSPAVLDGSVDPPFDTLLVPSDVRLSLEAQTMFANFVKWVSCELWDVDDVLIPWYKQLASQAARLALVLHLARCAQGEDLNRLVCDVDSLQAGIAMAKWFAQEARRVIALFSVSRDEQEQGRIIDWLHRRGGIATTRDLCRSNGRRYPTDDLARLALDKLVECGVGVWIDFPPGKNGGPAFRAFSLGRSYFEPLPQFAEVVPAAAAESKTASQDTGGEAARGTRAKPVVSDNCDENDEQQQGKEAAGGKQAGCVGQQCEEKDEKDPRDRWER